MYAWVFMQAYMGQVKLNIAFKHVLSVQIQIIPHMCSLIRAFALHWNILHIKKTHLFKLLKISPPKIESFQIKIWIFFIFLLET